MLPLLEQELRNNGFFTNQIHPILEAIAEAIPSTTIPIRMKLSIAVSEAILFVSQFRRNITHWNGSSIPINAITFSIAESGSGKDSAVNAARKCFSTGYELLNLKRNNIAKERAIRLAAEEGRNNPTEFSVYKAFIEPPNPLFAAPSTTEGLIQHLNDLDKAGIGAGHIYAGEIGAELATNQLMTDNIKLLAEMYDEGKKEVKLLKNRENQSREIKNLPLSALFVGSQGNLLYDDFIKKKFKTEFSTKLARRSFFNFNPEKIPLPVSTTIKEMLDSEMAIEESALTVRKEVNDYITEITHTLLKKVGEPIGVDQDAVNLFILYKRYNEYLAETVSHQYEISRLVRMHIQWKALKLAGAIAIYNQNDSITAEDYVYAANFCELLNNDMMLFEQELTKEPYELFVDYTRNNLTNGRFDISLHTLRKLGYIPMSGNPIQKIKELVHLASSYDNKGIYTSTNDSISYEEIQLTDTIGISYLPVTGSKDLRGRNCAEGYTYEESTFAELAQILEEDMAYSPFRFRNGKRGMDYIDSGCKWVCLDIDESTITDEEAHFLLSDINHHIVRTSDPTNAFKFRILVELDSVVDIDNIHWKNFITSISSELMVTCDVLPKAQIYFSYSNRTVLSVIDAEPLSAREHIIAATETTVKKIETLTKTQRNAYLNDPLETFHYAFYAKAGSRSRSLIRAAYHAKDLGATKDYIIDLMYQINDYLDYPLANEELERTIITQINRWNL